MAAGTARKPRASKVTPDAQIGLEESVMIDPDPVGLLEHLTEMKTSARMANSAKSKAMKKVEEAMPRAEVEGKRIRIRAGENDAGGFVMEGHKVMRRIPGPGHEEERYTYTIKRG